MAESVRGVMARREGRALEEDPNGAVLALRDDQTWWSPRQLAALKVLGIKNATNEELLVFLHYCAKTKLDPFSKQVYLLEKRAKEGGIWVYRQVIVVGIDGYRVVAQRAAARQQCHVEYEPTIWYDHQGRAFDVWLDEDHPPFAAKVTVVKVLPDGVKLTYPAVARFKSYAARSKQDNSLQGQWAVMEDHMIEKCAEAFGLRRAFPNDLGGTYSEEEVQHEPPPVLPARRRPPQDDDDDVIRSHAEPAAGPEDGAGDRAEGTGGSVKAESPAMTRKQATRAMNKVFNDAGMGGKDNAADRCAVISYLLSSPELIEFRELSDEDVARAARDLLTLFRSVTNTGGDVAEVLASSAAYYLTRNDDEQPAEAAATTEEDNG